MVARVSAGFTLAILLTLSSATQAQFRLFRSGPEIKEISAKNLYQTLVNRSQEMEAAKEKGNDVPAATFIIVDVRDPAEYQVSMLPGAITREHFERNIDSYTGLTVIPYCTVGGRSSQFAKQMASKGFNVVNFKDSIIGWCNARLPLVTPDGKPTNQVHTFNARNRVPSEYAPVH